MLKKSEYSQTANVMGYSLPDDSIWGYVDCTEPTEYELKADIAVQPSAVEAGETIRVRPEIANITKIDADTHQWKVTKFRYTPGVSAPEYTTVDGGSDVCSIYSSGLDCEDGNFIAPKGFDFGANASLPYISKTYEVDKTAAIGEKICFVVSVEQPSRSSGPNVWRHGGPACATVGIKPKIQVWGYDARVGGMIDTSLTSVDDTFGSWAEYGLASDSENKRMASGSGLNRGNGSPAQASWSDLTFANKLTVGGFGQFGSAGLPPIIPGSVTTADSGNMVDWTDIRSKPECNPNNKAVCLIEGTLKIDANISFNNGSLNSINGLDRLVIVADNIVISRNSDSPGPNTKPWVNRIDAWLFAKGDGAGNGGYISTCDAINNGGVEDADKYKVEMGNAGLQADECDNPLMFNAPVVANQIYLYRTNNNGRAETFNLRPDAFLSSLSGNKSGQPVATTESITELPPRF